MDPVFDYLRFQFMGKLMPSCLQLHISMEFASFAPRRERYDSTNPVPQRRHHQHLKTELDTVKIQVA